MVAKPLLTTNSLISTLRSDGLVYDWAALILSTSTIKHFFSTAEYAPHYKIFSRLVVIRLVVWVSLLSAFPFVLSAPLQTVIISGLFALSALMVNSFFLRKNVFALTKIVFEKYFPANVSENYSLYQFGEHMSKITKSPSLIDYFHQYNIVAFFLFGLIVLFCVFIYPHGFLRVLEGIAAAFFLSRAITFHQAWFKILRSK